jgi:hypothetical protein
MSRLSPNKVRQLIAKGRLLPILGTNKEGKKVVFGYKRKNSRSSKSHEQYMFAEPQVIEKDVASLNKEIKL